MKKIILYLISCLVLSALISTIHYIVKMPEWYLSNILLVRCTLIGATGGALYCIRAVYLNKCVLKQWDENWEVWYYLRPIAIAISGFISCVVLKAGLIVMEAETKPDAITFGYLAVAFIAGYNVDNFMKKLESIASSVWGIKKSRVSTEIKPSEKEPDGGRG